MLKVLLCFLILDQFQLLEACIYHCFGKIIYKHYNFTSLTELKYLLFSFGLLQLLNYWKNRKVMRSIFVSQIICFFNIMKNYSLHIT